MGTRGYIKNPPRCTICGFTIGRDDLFLFDDGSPACFNCTYRCSVCKVRTTYLTIVVGMQAFCETCFKCGDCKGKIRLVHGASVATSNGFYWFKCTARSFRSCWRECVEPVEANIPVATGQECRPASSQTQQQSLPRDDSTTGCPDCLMEQGDQDDECYPCKGCGEV